MSRPDLASHLRLTIARTARRLRQEAGSDLSPSMTAALATIERHGPMTPSELAARERVQRPTATRVIARLEEMGLLLRTADPQDRRSSLVAVTPAATG
jgi:DNA-binding MarR family transcriptional regulator